MANISIQTGAGTPPVPVVGEEGSSDPTLLDRIEALESAVAALQAANVAFLAAQFADAIAALEASDVVLAASVAEIEAENIAIEAEIATLEATDGGLLAADVVIEGDIDALEAADVAIDGRLDALEAEDIVLAGDITAIEADVTALEAADTATTTALALLRHQVNVNLIHNPSFEANTTGYVADDATMVRSSAAGVPFAGSWGLVVTTTNVTNSGVNYTTAPGLTPLVPHTFSFYARLASAGSKAMVIFVDWYDAADVALTEDTETFTLNSTTYARFDVTGTPPATASYAIIYVVTASAVGVFDYWVDGWQLEEGSAATALNADGDGVAQLNAYLDYGDDTGFLDFGESSKANAINPDSATGNAGYDREFDSVHAGGQILVATLNDAATFLITRQQDEDASVTGWPGSQGTARIDFGARDKNGAHIYPNGADNAIATITVNLHIPNAGDTPADGWADLRISCINELESSTTKPPRDICRFTGENGGEIWGTSYNSAGAVVTNTKLFP